MLRTRLFVYRVGTTQFAFQPRSGLCRQSHSHRVAFLRSIATNCKTNGSNKQANYRTRIWSFCQLCHSYGSHAPLFFSPSMLILVGFVHKSELWQQVNADVPPLCQAMVAMRRVCLGRPSYGSDSKLWQSPCPPNWSGPRCKSRFLCCFKCFARFPGQPSRAVNVPNAQTSGGKGTLWCISLVYATTCAQNQNGTSHLQVMALLMALTANYVNRHAHQMGRSLDRKENRGAEK